MKKLALYALLIFAASLSHGQSATLQGQFTITVAGFGMVGTCQPLPAPNIACALPNPVAGTAYSATLTTVGISAPVTCTATGMPAWMKIASSGTSCVLSGTPAPGAVSNLVVSVTGTVGGLVVQSNPQ